MAKRHGNETRDRARNFARDVGNRTGQDIFGGPNSAFGENGLALDRNRAGFRRDSAFNQAQAGFNRGIDYGGYEPATIDFLNRGYGEFADTGGFTPDDEANFRRRATSGVAGTYDVLRNEAERRRTMTGGLGTGGDMSRMARWVGQDQARAATDAEVDLSRMKREGRLAGMGGLANFHGDVARNRISASGGMAGLYNAATGEVSDMGRQILAMYGLSDASQETQLRVLAQLSSTPGIMDNIQRVGGMVAGGLGAIPGLGA